MITTLGLHNPITDGIRALYGFAGSVENGIDQLVEKMKQSENSTVTRTATVIEGAKYGFGIGYATSVIVIAAGQIILGNTFNAVVTVATAATLTNPIAMTCGAIGAIYYGWRALSDEERNAILSRLKDALGVGGELIKSIINYVVSTMKELLSTENLAEVKRFISEATKAFDRSLSDVTKAIKDTVVDSYQTVSHRARQGASDAHDFITKKLSKEKLSVEVLQIDIKRPEDQSSSL